MKSEMDRYAQLKNFKKSNAGDNYDVIYHRINWNINPHVDSMSGVINTHFITKTDNFNAVAFDLADGLSVDSVKYHGNMVPFEHSADIVRADLPSGLNTNVTDSITVFYSGDPTKTSTRGSYVREKRRPKNDHPVIWTLSEPYGAMTWWPCKQSLSDKIDSLDIFITVPQGNKAASNGLLVDSVKYDTFITYHWKHRYPIVTYLVAIAVTNYAEFSDWYHFNNGDSLEILNYLYPESVASMREPAKATIEIMHLFDSLFGEYPFAKEKYGHAQFGRGGGMEHQTMSFMVDLNFALVAHELAHQWFGNATTCRSWSDLWLNEGFATFLTLLAYENLTDRETYLARAESTRKAVTTVNDGSVFVADTLDVSRLFSSRLTYNKGAMLLQMLRYRLGDDVFYSAIRKYLNAPEHLYGFARTDDLIKFLELESSTDLSLFFDQWYYSEGFPIIDIIWRTKGSLVEVNLTQKTSHESVAFFDTPLPIKFIGEEQDTIINFHADNENWTTVVNLTFEPKSVVVDPDVRILARTNVFRGRDLRDRITIFPNPAENTLNFEAAPFFVENIEIYTVEGAKAMEINPLLSGIKAGEINVKGLSPGLYFIKFIGSGESLSVKFIKQFR